MAKKNRPAKKVATEGVVPSLATACNAALRYAVGREPNDASEYDKFQALAIAVRSQLVDRWLKTENRIQDAKCKRVYYLSLEFLMGRSLQNTVLNLDIEEDSRKAIRNLGMVLEDLYDREYDPGLGNGGLGRLAACFLDSMATLDLPAKGYGIRYEYGIFHQIIEDGYQVEKPDYWLFRGFPWETPRIENIQRVKFYGRTRHFTDLGGQQRVEWIEADEVCALPFEIPVPGYGTSHVNLLTLWSARASNEFNLDYFNHGDYMHAVAQKENSEYISKVLYPGDAGDAGKELRLKQQYFFVSASLQEILDDFCRDFDDFGIFPDKVAIQLNDTHPAIAVPELMRLLMDEKGLPYSQAWDITRRTFAYTNHTLLPEALEKWNVDLLGRLLPRHLEIIYTINHEFLQTVAAEIPNDEDAVRRMSIVAESPVKQIRMAHLAVVGSHSVNGVAALHTDLIKQNLFSDFHRLWPEKINNKTNGITQRRWLKQANPALANLITDNIGDGWVTDLNALTQLSGKLDSQPFRDNWSAVKELNKIVLADFIKEDLGVEVDPHSMFDVQVKRIHEYKRQLLNVLGVAARYFRLKDGRGDSFTPRTVMIGGKAAPGYFLAKLVIKLINDIALVVNHDPATRDVLKLIFLPNYRVSLAERIFPASDLSQQISTAGTEASGTGNMKFALNGALTIGTLDGANIEIKDAVGDDNIFIFGMNTQQVEEAKRNGYNPRDQYVANDELRFVLDQINNGYFSPDDPTRFRPIVDSLLDGGDHYLVLADFQSYIDCQLLVDAAYRDTQSWTDKSIRNVANMGYFSSDRTIDEYARDIWQIKPVP